VRRLGIFCLLLQLPFVGYLATARLPQEPSGAQEPPEMLVTEEGFLAIDTPRGWLRAEGPWHILCPDS
jgi:hypothetical protein